MGRTLPLDKIIERIADSAMTKNYNLERHKTAIIQLVLEMLPKEKDNDWGDTGFKWKQHEDNGWNSCLKTMRERVEKLGEVGGG